MAIEKVKGKVTAVNQRNNEDGTPRNYGIALGKDNWYNGLGTLPCKKGDEVELCYQQVEQWKNLEKDGVYVSDSAPAIPTADVPQPVAPQESVPSTKVLCWENMSLSNIVAELNKLNTCATQFYPNPNNTYDCVAWLR